MEYGIIEYGILVYRILEYEITMPVIVRVWYEGDATSTHLNMSLGRVFNESFNGVLGA